MRPDPAVVETFLRYARLLAARGYVHNTLGNIVLRAAHPDFPHGIAYTKHAELSLEEMTADNIVITDIPTSRVLYGGRTTSIGHNLSREILRLRPDIHATIHVHDDALIAFLACGAHPQIGMLSLDPPFVLGKPIHYVEAHVDVAANFVGSVRSAGSQLGGGASGSPLWRARSRQRWSASRKTAPTSFMKEKQLNGSRPKWRSMAASSPRRTSRPTRPSNAPH